jgi:hypothetical protein
MMQRGEQPDQSELLIYRDLFGEDHEVIYIDTSPESGNHYVIPVGKVRGIWLRPDQLSRTGRIYEPDRGQEAKGKPKQWRLGDPVPDHAIKKRGGRKK